MHDIYGGACVCVCVTLPAGQKGKLRIKQMLLIKPKFAIPVGEEGEGIERGIDGIDAKVAC